VKTEDLCGHCEGLGLIEYLVVTGRVHKVRLVTQLLIESKVFTVEKVVTANLNVYMDITDSCILLLEYKPEIKI
jgi:hypothetical protein